MPSDPPPPTNTDPLVIYTFEYWQSQYSGTPTDNVLALNMAIAWSSSKKIPIYILGTDYYFEPSAGNSSIILRPNASVICAPKCNLYWKPRNSDPTPAGIVTNAVDPGTGLRIAAHNARWRGGRLVGQNAGGYPKGRFFNLVGDDMVLEDTAVEACRDFAFSLNGDRIRLLNARVSNIVAASSKGVEFTGGSGFRMLDGQVTTSNHAVMICPDGATETGMKTKVSDCTVQGTALETSPGASDATGRSISIETTSGEISDVRLEGMMCKGREGTGNAVRIRNAPPNTTSSITNISLRDIVVDWSERLTGTAETILISNLANIPASKTSIANISIDNVRVLQPKGTTLAVTAAYGAIENLTWDGGGVIATPSTNAFACITLNQLNGAAFRDLSIAAGGSGPVISLGAALPCKNVMFGDVAITEIASAKTGIVFDRAISCGWVSGRMVEAAGASGVIAASFTANAVGCDVEDADLSGVQPATTDGKITADPSAGYRLRDNIGSSQRTAIGLGAPVTVQLMSNAIAVKTSFAAISVPAGQEPNLKTVALASKGDLLTITGGAGSFTVRDGAAGGNLKLAGDFAMASINDTLTLLCRASDWIEIARSPNG